VRDACIAGRPAAGAAMNPERYRARPLPGALSGLVTLALNLRWSWHHGADRLWERLDPESWAVTRNAWLILETVSEDRLQALAQDDAFLAELEDCLAAHRRHLDADTWFSGHSGVGSLEAGVAYFSMEFGVTESVPIYSGGLGVLAGDYLKTCCDLGVPVVGIGLLYQQGYFRQQLDADGAQLEFYPYNDPSLLPVLPLRDRDGSWVRVSVELPGRVVYLRIWQAEVGRRWLYLLDSNHPLNQPGDRGITSALYGGTDEVRLQQELVLGIGGWRLLVHLGLECPVCHLNEGHAAFAALERARHFMQVSECRFEEALAVTRAGNLFTTHTPVSAAFDRFPSPMVRRYLAAYAGRIDEPVERLLALGGADRGHPFNTALLAIRCSGAVNGVSRLHGEVSRRLFQTLFPRWPGAEVPVGHITNGVHVPGWDSPEADDVWTTVCGVDRWRGGLETMERDLASTEDATLWRMRAGARARLVQEVRRRIARQVDGPEDALDPDALTLGFARRFAAYKRPNLLLTDPDRLAALVSRRERPLQLVLAGKAHPLDGEGKRLLRAWVTFARRPDVCGRVVFVEDYDLRVAATFVQGVDVWINTPRRPWEASGTSGMKVLANGGLNLSDLDGWWVEAYEPDLGWALGDGGEHGDDPGWDAHEADALYGLLEREIIPAFYERDAAGIPCAWMAWMRASMTRLTPRFSSNRMLREYVEQYYLPLAARYRERAADGGAAGARLVESRRALERHWSTLRFGAVGCETGDDGHRFRVEVYLDDLPEGAVAVELYADEAGTAGRVVSLRASGRLAGTAGGWTYTGVAPADRPAADYTARIVPGQSGLALPLEDAHILWHH
jgi:starch phosphorylase